MSICLSNIALDFEPNGRIHFHEWRGNSWDILFSHTADFTSDNHKVPITAKWQVADEQIKLHFQKGYCAVKPYLHLITQQNR